MTSWFYRRQVKSSAFSDFIYADRQSARADFHHPAQSIAFTPIRQKTHRMGVGVSLRPCGVKGPRGPPFLGAPNHLPGLTIYPPWGPGAPSAGLSYPVFRLGPAHFGSSADPRELFHRNRTACRAVSAVPPLVTTDASQCHVGDPGAPSAACCM